LSAFLTSRAVFPHMRESGGGAIINFARAGLSQANMLAYNCAKAGVEALTRTLALEGRDSAIRVNAVAPGLVDTASNIAAMKPKILSVGPNARTSLRPSFSSPLLPLQELPVK